MSVHDLIGIAGWVLFAVGVLIDVFIFIELGDDL